MRDLTNDFTDALTATVKYATLLFEAEYDEDNLLLWGGIGDLTWDGKTFTGAGTLGQVSRIEETSDLRAARVGFRLSGIPSDLLSIAFNEDYHNRPVRCWLALFDSDWQVIADPAEIFGGRQDVMQLDEDGESAVIKLTAENRLIDLQKSAGFRYTPEDQKSRFPGDKGLDFGPLLPDREISWSLREIKESASKPRPQPQGQPQHSPQNRPGGHFTPAPTPQSQPGSALQRRGGATRDTFNRSGRIGGQ